MKRVQLLIGRKNPGDFQLRGFVLANDTQLNDDLIHLQVLMGEKNAEIAHSTGLFTHTALAYQYFPD